MINQNVYTSPDRSNKLVAPNSPQARRKNGDFPGSLQVGGMEHPRKESSNPQLSPQHIYYPKPQSARGMDASMEKDVNMEGIIRELSDKVIKLGKN